MHTCPTPKCAEHCAKYSSITWESQSRGNTRGQCGSSLPCYHKATGPSNLQDVCCTEGTAQPEDPTYPLSVTPRSRAQIGNLGRWGEGRIWTSESTGHFMAEDGGSAQARTYLTK